MRAAREPVRGGCWLWAWLLLLAASACRPTHFGATLAPDDVAVESSADRTSIGLPNGRTLVLAGSWSLRPTLPDRALLYQDALAAYGSGWHVRLALDAGARRPRIVHEQDHRQSALPGSGAVWSSDRTTFYDWTDTRLQLMAFDVDGSRPRSLTAFPDRLVHYKGISHLEPRPLRGGRGAVLDESVGQLLYVAQSPGNDEVWFWQRRPGRRSGQVLLAVATNGSGVEVLADQVPACPWDISAKRRRLLSLECDGARPVIVWRDFEGTIEQRMDIPVEDGRRLVLDPTEQHLVVEEQDGFVVLDADEGTLLLGQDRGYACAWAPDGRRLAFRDDDELAVLDITTGVRQSLARLEGVVHNRFRATTDVEPGAWSPDGRWLAATVGRHGVPVRARAPRLARTDRAARPGATRGRHPPELVG